MTKYELMQEVRRLIMQVYRDELDAVVASSYADRAIDIYSGDLVPVDWESVAWGTPILYNGTVSGTFLGVDSPQRIIILVNGNMNITKVSPDNVEIV